MSAALSAPEVLNRYFLDMRSRVLDLAAALDRVECAKDPQAATADPRLTKLHNALKLLTDGNPNRAERVQLLFSQSFDPAWRNIAK